MTEHWCRVTLSIVAIVVAVPMALAIEPNSTAARLDHQIRTWRGDVPGASRELGYSRRELHGLEIRDPTNPEISRLRHGLDNLDRNPLTRLPGIESRRSTRSLSTRRLPANSELPERDEFTRRTAPGSGLPRGADHRLGLVDDHLARADRALDEADIELADEALGNARDELTALQRFYGDDASNENPAIAARQRRLKTLGGALP